MFNWMRRRKLSPEARRKLLILSARAEEAILETHVSNLVSLLEELSDEVDLDRGITLYMEMMELSEDMASNVANRLLARLESSSGRTGRRSGRFQHIFREERTT